jgi:type II secretory pathway component PulK
MMSPTELMNMPGFGVDRYLKIAPYVTALPTARAVINVCTAPAPVLESFADSLRGEYSSPQVLANGRKAGCFPDLDSFRKIVGPKELPAITNWFGASSTYFRLTTRVTLGTSEFTLYSLLKRNGNKVTPLMRTFGTP